MFCPLFFWYQLELTKDLLDDDVVLKAPKTQMKLAEQTLFIDTEFPSLLLLDCSACKEKDMTCLAVYRYGQNGIPTKDIHVHYERSTLFPVAGRKCLRSDASVRIALPDDDRNIWNRFFGFPTFCKIYHATRKQ